MGFSTFVPTRCWFVVKSRGVGGRYEQHALSWLNFVNVLTTDKPHLSTCLLNKRDKLDKNRKKTKKKSKMSMFLTRVLAETITQKTTTPTNITLRKLFPLRALHLHYIIEKADRRTFFVLNFENVVCPSGIIRRMYLKWFEVDRLYCCKRCWTGNILQFIFH